jgi:acyl dehydratase
MSSPTRIRSLKAVHDHVARPLGTSGWIATDQASVDMFAQITRDEQWIHCDPERAARGPFASAVAHGFYTLALCSFFLTEVVDVTGADMIINYGLDRVRFPAPVAVGARLRGAAELVAAEDVADGVQTLIRMTIEVEGCDKPACVADLIMRFNAKPDG